MTADLIIDTQSGPVSHQYIITSLYFPYHQFYSRYLIVMNIPSAHTILKLLILITITTDSSLFVECLYSSLVKSTTLPIEVRHGVVYMQLGHLCKAEIVNTLVGTEIKEWVEESQSQFEELSTSPHETDVKVLLDTGSSEFWLADSACSNCGRTKSLCPQLSAPEKKITYMKGFIEGADSYINLCNNRIKFTCVKSAQSIGQIKGEGILGLKQGTVGLNMLFNIVKKRSKQFPENKVSPVGRTIEKQFEKSQKLLIERNEIGFQFDKYRNSLYLANSRIVTTNKQMLEDPHDMYIKTDENWSFGVQEISMFDSVITIKQTPYKQQGSQMTAYVDSGSSKIVFTGSICGSMLKQIKQELNIECVYVEDKGIDCNRIIRDLNLQFTLGQVRNNSNMVVRIENSRVMDGATNRLQILCQYSSSKNSNKIILGYPFLQSVPTVFTISHIKNQSQNQNTQQLQYAIRLTQDRSAGNGDYELTVYRFLLLLYLLIVGALGWSAVFAIDFIRRKRSTQIII